MASNGSTTTTVKELARIIDRPEAGTAVEPDRLFLYWDDAYYTPDEFEARQIENMLAVDGKARTLEQVLTLPLRGAGYDILPGEGDSGQADFADALLKRPANLGGMNTPFDLVLSQMTGAVLFRRVYFEKVLKVLDGQIVYDKLAWRPPASCKVKYDKHTGAFQGFKQYVGIEPERTGVDEQGYVHFEPQRSFVLIHGQHRKPLEGLSDLDTAYQIFKTKQKVRWLWLRFLENQTMPKAIAKNDTPDAGATLEFAKKVASLKGGGVVGIGPEQSVEPFESDGSGAQTYRDALAYLDSEMSGSVLAGFTDLTSLATSGRGSYALAESATDFFKASRQTVLDEFGTAISSYVLADLIKWNFGVSAPVPTFKFEPIKREDAQTAIDLLKSISTGQGLNPAFPRVFVDELVVQVAKLLNMDESKIEEAVRNATQNAQTPVDEVRSAVDWARERVQESGIGQAA